MQTDIMCLYLIYSFMILKLREYLISLRAIILKECLEDYINSFGEVVDDIKTTTGSPGGHNLK